MAEQHLQMKYKLWIFHAINNTKHGVLKVQLWTFLVVESGRTQMTVHKISRWAKKWVKMITNKIEFGNTATYLSEK
jgi:hypothetical protein